MVATQALGRRSALTLRFADAGMEAGYSAERAAADLPLFRLGLAIAVPAWLALSAMAPYSVVHSELSAEAFARAVSTVRLVQAGVMVPLLLLCLGLTRWARTMSQQQVMGGVMNCLAGFCMLGACVLGGTFARYAAFGMVGAMTYAFVALRLRFITAAVASLPYIAGYFVIVLVQARLPTLAFEVFGVVILWLISGLSAYLIESSARQVYAQRLEIEHQQRDLAAERDKSERLLLNVLPASVVALLKEREGRIAERFEDATVMFADIVGFTPLSAQMEPERVVALLDDLFSRFDTLAERHGLEKIKTIGDAYMVVGGLPERRADHAVAIAAMALEMLAAVAGHRSSEGVELGVRIGIHSGPVVAGVIGRKKFIYDLWGDTVNTASRMESHGIPGEVQITAATWERIQHAFDADERGVFDVKGKGPMPLFLLRRRRSPA